MIKVLEQAIEKVKSLSKDRQAYAAYVLEEIAADVDGADMTDEERRLVQEGIDAADRGEFANEEDVQAVLGRYRA